MKVGERVMMEERNGTLVHEEAACYFAHHFEARVKKLLSSFVVDRFGSVIHHGVVTHQLEVCLNIRKTGKKIKIKHGFYLKLVQVDMTYMKAPLQNQISTIVKYPGSINTNLTCNVSHFYTFIHPFTGTSLLNVPI